MNTEVLFKKILLVEVISKYTNSLFKEPVKLGKDFKCSLIFMISAIFMFLKSSALNVLNLDITKKFNYFEKQRKLLKIVFYF